MSITQNLILPDESFEIIDYLMRDKLKKYKNIFFIQQSYKELENVIIAGTTLWFKTHKTDYTESDIKIIGHPFFIIKKDKYIPSLNYISNINHKQYNWLSNFINGHKKTSKQIIIVTHYLPSKKCIHKKWHSDPDNDLFFTDCENLFQHVNYWISGHTHDPCKITQDKCEIIVNPIGTPFENTDYNEKLVIDISHNKSQL